MELKWNLKNLFENDGQFYKEIEKVKKMCFHIKSYENKKLDENSLLELLNEKWRIKEITDNILVYGSLKYYQNVKSEECIELKKIGEEFNNQVDFDLSFIDKKIIAIGKNRITEFYSKNPSLKIYELSLNDLFRKQEHIKDDTITEQIKENIDKINTQLNLYNKEIRDIKYGEIENDEKKIEITSSNFAKYISARDRNTRKQTYVVVNERFQNSQETFARILDLIIGFRINNAKLEDYNSVLEKVLFEENIDSKIIDTLIKEVNNHLNLMQEYLKWKADKLEISDPHLYDFGVPLDDNLKTKYTFDEAIRIIKNALKPLGNQYLKVVDKLLNGHIDAEPDDNKDQSIIFSWHTYAFMNFKGSYGDLKNLIHEIGHIVNYDLSKNNVPYLYEDSTVFVGETASLVNEILLNKYLYENAETKEEKIFYLTKEIENYITTIFKQTMYTEFENDLYHTKLTNDLSSNLLAEKYEKIIQKYYGSGIIYDKVSNIEWARLGKLYRWSYCHYKYATGLIIASVIVNALLNEKTISQEQYLKFLSSGSSLYSLDLLEQLSIDLTEPTIIKNGFKVLENDLNELNKMEQENEK